MHIHFYPLLILFSGVETQRAIFGTFLLPITDKITQSVNRGGSHSSPLAMRADPAFIGYFEYLAMRQVTKDMVVEKMKAKGELRYVRKA